MAVLMCLQRRFTSELLVVALGALTAWSAFICGGRLPAWLQALWGDRITEDSDPKNLPLRIWLPLLMLAIIIAGALIWYTAHF
jgi:hypothetical protein